MLDGGGHRFGDEIASLIGWWAEAGVTAFVDEAPRDWLAPLPDRPAAPASIEASPPPADLATYVAHLKDGDYLPGAPPPSRRIAPEGPAGVRLMIVTDMPDEADLRARSLLATEAALFAAMLKAMGFARADVHLAPLSPARITGGRLGAAAQPLATLMRTHLALVRPQALLLFGDETSRALLGVERAEAGAALRTVNHDGGTVAAIATIHPRTLLRQPGRKAEAWAAMRLLLGVLAS